MICFMWHSCWNRVGTVAGDGAVVNASAHGPISANQPWWRHEMETFSALLALCAGNSPVTVMDQLSLWFTTRTYATAEAWLNCFWGNCHSLHYKSYVHFIYNCEGLTSDNTVARTQCSWHFVIFADKSSNRTSRCWMFKRQSIFKCSIFSEWTQPMLYKHVLNQRWEPGCQIRGHKSFVSQLHSWVKSISYIDG